MKLIMIHGRGQAGKEPAGLKREWLDALTYGCARAGVALPQTTAIELPYYGDLLAELVAQATQPVGPAGTAKGQLDDPTTALRAALLEQLARHAGLSAHDVQLALGNTAIARGPQHWEWVQAILRTFDRLPGINSRVIDLFTRDVAVYLTYPEVRRRVDAVVAAALPDEPCVVLAHSLGSVVAYNVLRERPELPRYPRLITVGSPLGIRAIRQRLDTPLVSPRCIGHWFNAYDDRDVVALAPLDESTFNVLPAIENKRDVLNFTDNRHGIAGYLADPVVASKIVEWL